LTGSAARFRGGYGRSESGDVEKCQAKAAHFTGGTPDRTARRFGKIRSARSGALFEDYVELIADLLATSGEARPIDVARRLGVSHATAIKVISRLKRATDWQQAVPIVGCF
jgi:hypothetical protein